MSATWLCFRILIDGQTLPKDLLQVDLQPEVGAEGYDAGASISISLEELEKFLVPDLDPLGRKIIETCLRDGSLQEYVDLIK